MRIFDPRLPNPQTDTDRRAVLRAGGGLGVLGTLAALGLLHPSLVRAESDRTAFDAKTVADTLSAAGLGGAAASTDIALEAPEIAENGAVVPVRVSTAMSRADRIAILVEKNPTILSAVFQLPEGTEPSIHTRVKMAETCRIIVAVRSDGKVYLASREVKVTAGGCGG